MTGFPATDFPAHGNGSAAPGERPRLAVTVDRGSAWTKAAVITSVRGRWRIAAHASQPSAWSDDELLASLVRPLEAAVSGAAPLDLPELVRDAPRIECGSAAATLSIALVCDPGSSWSLAARRTAEASGWRVVEAATGGDPDGNSDLFARLRTLPVDAWLVVLTPGLRRRQAEEVVGLVLAARGARPLPVVLLSPTGVVEHVRPFVDGGADSPLVVELPAARLPSGGDTVLAPLGRVLADVLADGIARTRRPLAAHGFRRAVAALAERSRLRILAVDLGAREASWVSSLDGAVDGAVAVDGGVASPALAHSETAAQLALVLAGAVEEVTVRDVLRTAAAWPTTLPETEEELLVTGAAARHQLAALLAGTPRPPFDLVIGSGRAVATAPPAVATEILLEAVRPLGVTQLAVDAAGVLAPLGTLSTDAVRGALPSVREDLLATLGAAVICRGGTAGETSMRVTVRGRRRPQDRFHVRYGQLVVVPLPTGEAADIEVELDRSVSLGEPRRAHRVRARVNGGSVGLILDARDIPIALPKRPEDRRPVLEAWRDAVAHEGAASSAAA